MYTYSKNYRPQTHYRRLPPPKKPRPTFSIRKLAFIFILLFTVLFFAKAVIAHSSKSSSSNDSTPSAHQEPPKRQVNTSSLAASLTQITSQYPYNTSVSVIDLNSGTSIRSGDTYPFIAASTTKILTALAYFTAVEQGKTGLDDKLGGATAKKQLELAINRSDNTAWRVLNDDLGKESLHAYAAKQGLTSYDPQDNKITSDDMAKLLAKLHNRELLNEEHTKLLLSWMQDTSEERFIPAAVPDNITAYHKAGYLNDRVHDVAIIDNGSAPFVLVIYSKTYSGAYDYTRGQTLYKQITQQVITTFQ